MPYLVDRQVHHLVPIFHHRRRVHLLDGLSIGQLFLHVLMSWTGRLALWDHLPNQRVARIPHRVIDQFVASLMDHACCTATTPDFTV